MLRTKLTIWSCAVLALVLGATGAAIYLTTRATLFHSVDSTLLRRAHLFAAQWHGLSTERKVDLSDSSYIGIDLALPIDPEAARREGIDPKQLHRLQTTGNALRPMVLSPAGIDLLASTRSAWDMAGFRKAQGGQETFSDITFDGIPLRVLSMPLLENGKITAVTQLAVPLQWEQDQLAHLGRTLSVVLPLAVGLMLVAGVILTRRALRPISQIASAAETIEATNLNARLSVVGNDEFAQLNATFNRMLARLHDAFEEKDLAFSRQKQFTSDASHELKTPLTAILARAGIALGSPADSEELLEHMAAIKRAAGLMNSVLQDLLILAASDEGHLVLRKEQIAVIDLVEDALASVDTSRQHVEVHVDSSLALDCDSAALTRVLVNLIQNAVAHTPEDMGICISAADAAGMVSLTVRDEGRGIRHEQVALVFNRFYRIDPSRDRKSGGTGLGLAIAKAIVEAHDGKISLESQVGHGTTVRIDLPSQVPCEAVERIGCN